MMFRISDYSPANHSPDLEYIMNVSENVMLKNPNMPIEKQQLSTHVVPNETWNPRFYVIFSTDMPPPPGALVLKQGAILKFVT